MNNTSQRIVSAVWFGILMLASFLLGNIAFSIIFPLLMVLMLLEFYKMTTGKWNPLIKACGIASAIVLFFLMQNAASGRGITIMLCLFVLFLLVILCRFIFSKDGEQVDYAYIFTGLLYIALPVSLSNFVVFTGGEFSGYMLMLFFLIIWAGDIGAYAVGCTLGKKYNWKLCPSISPKKTWIGAAGGFVFAIVISIASVCVLSRMELLSVSLWHAAGLAIVINIFGTLGDLCESRWKRIFGLKDSGKIIPGHGGMLDRLDSSLFAIPAGLFYMMLFNLI